MPKRRNNNKDGNGEMSQAARLSDNIAQFEQFRQEILPALRADLLKGLDAKAIYSKYQSHAAARGVTIAMTSTEEGKALTAIKDILDRSDGKAVERKEVEHRYGKLDDTQLNAVFLTQLEEVDDEETS